MVFCYTFEFVNRGLLRKRQMASRTKEPFSNFKFDCVIITVPNIKLPDIYVLFICIGTVE